MSSSEDPTFDVHDVHWTRAKSARFWNYLSTRPEVQEIYFSRLVGDTIVKLVARAGVSLRGRVLDFGCGPGYLVESLIRSGIPCEGADFSANSVAELAERLRGEKRFLGSHHLAKLPSTLPADTFDVVFLIETIEHLLDTDLESTVTELHRILRPGGTLIITTPNDEDLTRSQVLCPDCGGRFHVMQHVRHWSEESLTRYLHDASFRHKTTRKVVLRPSQAGTFAFSVATRLLRRKQPNLLWMGTKA